MNFVLQAWKAQAVIFGVAMRLFEISQVSSVCQGTGSLEDSMGLTKGKIQEG